MVKYNQNMSKQNPVLHMSSLAFMMASMSSGLVETSGHRLSKEAVEINFAALEHTIQ